MSDPAGQEAAEPGFFDSRDVHPAMLPGIMRKHIYTGVMGNVYGYLISGILFVYFGRRIGLSRFQWGLMSGISSFLIGAQLLSALITQRTGKRKFIWFWCAVVERSLRLGGILLALLLWSRGWPHAGLALIGAVCLSNLFGTMAGPPWMSWLADIIPEAEHGAFWGRRSAWIALAVIVVVVPAGFLVDRVAEAHKLDVIVALFIAAGVVGLLDIVIHGTIPEPTPLRSPGGHFVAELLAPLRDPGFRPWLVFNLSWHFAMSLGGGLATLYFVKELRLDRNFLGGTIVLTALTLIGSLASARWSGRLVDRLGMRRVLFWGHVFWGMLPGFWIFATPRTALPWLAAGSIVSGTASTAAETATNKLVTRFPPPAQRAMYVAVSASLGSAASGVAMILAGALLRWLGDRHVQALGQTWCAFHILFVGSLVLRLAAITLIRRITDTNNAIPAR